MIIRSPHQLEVALLQCSGESLLARRVYALANHDDGQIRSYCDGFSLPRYYSFHGAFAPLPKLEESEWLS